MDTEDFATALEAWAESLDTNLNAYPDEPDSYLEAFPLVAARIVSDQELESSGDFNDQAYQQVHAQVITAELIILVAPTPAWTADQTLWAIVDKMKASLRKDQTLGGRVEQATPLYSVEYQGEVQTADGTRANMATFTITLGERVRA